MKILYLGLRPKKGTIHYPVIHTKRCPLFEEVFIHYDLCTHMVFTSRTAVFYWEGPWSKPCIAISEETAKELQRKGVKPLIAPWATQEGVMHLLSQIKGFFFLPQSQRARKDLQMFLREKKIPHYAFALYETHFQQLEPVPNLEEFDEIVFTSPSTVEGFLRIFKTFPKGKRFQAIGPITQRALEQKGALSYIPSEKEQFYGRANKLSTS